MMDAAALEKLMRRSNPALAAERAALAAGRWADYLRERVPAPSRLEFARRRAWQQAYDRALQLGHASAERQAIVFPVWHASNEDDVPKTAWKSAAVVSYEDGTHELYEGASLGPIVVEARVEEARIGFIMPSRYYAPEIQLPYRNEHYVAVESRRIERVVSLERVVEGKPEGRPGRAVPAFAVDAAAALQLGSVEPELARRIELQVERLRHFPVS